MAKYCQTCGQKLPLFYSGTICKDCKKENQANLDELITTISKIKEVTEKQIEFLKKQDKKLLILTYSKVYDHFESDNELDKTEIETLNKIQEATGLSKEDAKYDERVLPYIYVLALREEEKLPTINLQIEGSSPIILKKGEIIHFADRATLKEMRTVSLGYQGGSRGVSIRICKGVSYRAGAHRGHVAKEDRLVETSKGALIVSNQRLFLHPAPGFKPLSIPLTKILSYQCFNNGIEMYKEGRDKGYFLSMDKGSSPEIIGICLGHLLEQ